MAHDRRAVRVFISSTFRDMHAERDHLVTVVFPELRERLARLDLEFYDVDLRWGVPKRGIDGETANSWEYCKKWIDQVRPFFLCLLGERYGTVPPAEEIKDAGDRRRWAGLSITEMEIRYAALDHDRGHRCFFYLREPKVPATAAPEIFRDFVDVAQHARMNRLRQDILRSGRTIRHYSCQWRGDRFDDLDAFGRMVLEDLWGAVLRDPGCVPRSAWQQALGRAPESDPTHADPDTPIPPEICRRLVDAAKPPPGDRLDAERAAMAAFARPRLRWFRGRETEIERLIAFATGPAAADAPRLCCVRGPSGQGKSTLVAAFVAALRRARPNDLIVEHYVGAVDGSSDVRRLLLRLTEELRRRQPDGASDPADDAPADRLDAHGLARRLARQIEPYAGEDRIVLVIDAVNQLDADHDLTWLPKRLGAGVRVVLSTAASAQAGSSGAQGEREEAAGRVVARLASQEPPPLWIDLAPLGPRHVRTIIEDYLKDYCKELDAPAKEVIARLPQAGSPLYLLVALHELRLLGGNDMGAVVNELIGALAHTRPDAVALFDWVLERLEVAFGDEATRAWCSYLALGRSGMSGRELHDLTRRKLGERHGPAARRIERALRQYLEPRGGTLCFFHDALREAVERRYLPDAAATTRLQSPAALHGDIADYFAIRWRDGDHRALRERRYHLLQARRWDEAAALIDPQWRAAKRQAFGSDAAFLDDLAALAAAPIAGALDHATHLGAIALSVALKDADDAEIDGELQQRLAAGAYREILRWAPSAGVEPQACREMLARAAAGTAALPGDLVAECARRLAALGEAGWVATWVAAAQARLQSDGHDVDALCLDVAAAAARRAPQQINYSEPELAVLLDAWAPIVRPATLEKLWRLAFEAVATASTSGAPFLAAACLQLRCVAEHCPPGGRDAVLDLICRFADQADAVGFNHMPYQSIALKACGRALACLLSAAEVFELSQSKRLKIGGSAPEGRPARSALRLGATREFVERKRWDEAGWLAKRFVAPSARVEALSLLLAAGPEDDIPQWQAEFLQARRTVAAASARARNDLTTIFASVSHVRDDHAAEQLLNGMASSTARQNLSEIDAARRRLIGPALAALDLLSTPSPDGPAASSDVARDDHADGATAKVARLAALWGDAAAAASKAAVADGAEPAEESEERGRPRLAGEPGAAASEWGQRILENAERYMPGPGMFLLLPEHDERRGMWSETTGVERAHACLTRWSDSACIHVRNVIEDIAGKDQWGVFGVSEGDIARFEALRAACELALEQGSPHAAGLIGCLSMAAQDLRRGGSTGLLGPVRLRAKLVVSRLIGRYAISGLPHGGAEPFEMAQTVLYATTFAVSQVVDALASVDGAEWPSQRRDDPAIPSLVDTAHLDPLYASIIKARWFRRRGDIERARRMLLEAHDRLHASADPEADAESPDLREVKLACLAREMAHVDGRAAFAWSRAIAAPGLRCASLAASLCLGRGWGRHDAREALAELVTYAVRNERLSSQGALRSVALETIAETLGYPQFPPFAWEEVAQDHAGTVLAQMTACAAQDPGMGLATMLDDAVARASADHRGDLVAAMAGTADLPLDWVVRAARHLVVLPFDRLIEAFVSLARELAGRGARDICVATKDKSETLAVFFRT
jgi:hypothetical protein